MDVSPERWRILSSLLDEALDLPPDGRDAFLDRRCADDPELRGQLARLLRASDRPAELLDRPAFAAAGEVLRELAEDEGALEAGQQVGAYRLIARLGEGGMGEVWLAEQSSPVRRQVALKVIKAGMDTRQVIARFEAERQALALMDHPWIAKVLDAGATPRGLPFFVMEHVSGEPITTFCDRRLLSTPERLELFLKVCDGVQHAHQKGIIHRDLKPSNVLVSLQDRQPAPKIIDFGVAKATATPLTERSRLTELGMLIGTPEYMSPEQAAGSGLDVDTRSDVYSLGVMLYELLAGVLPGTRESDPAKPSARVKTSGEKSAELARQRGTDPGRLVSRLRGDLDWIALKALEKEPGRRYGSPRELADDIERHLRDEPVAAGPPSAIYRTTKFARRHRVAVAFVAAATTGLVAFGVTMGQQARRVARERDRAERVSDFLVELFRVSNPGETRGNSVTAREILDRGAERIERELSGQPEMQAQLLDTMGHVYWGLGLWGKAGEIFERALALHEGVQGPDSPQAIAARSSLASIRVRQGRYAEGMRLFQTVFDWRARELGPDHPDTLDTLNSLAFWNGVIGRYTEAERLHRAVLDARRRVLGPDDAGTLWSANDLALMHIRLGRYGEAETLLRDVLERWRRKRASGGVFSDQVFQSNLADALRGQGRYDEAEALMRQVLESHRSVLGTDHPHTLIAMKDLGILLHAEGRYDEAAQLDRQTLEIRRRVLGPEHPGTLESAYRLAAVERDQRRDAEAAELLLPTLAAQRRALGPDHPDTLNSASCLARVLARLGRFEESAELSRAALDAFAVRPQAEDTDTRQAFYDLACAAALRGEPDEARECLRRASAAGWSESERAAADPDLRPLGDEPIPRT